MHHIREREVIDVGQLWGENNEARNSRHAKEQADVLIFAVVAVDPRDDVIVFEVALAAVSWVEKLSDLVDL